MASSLAACLRLVGFVMPRMHDVVPLFDVDGVVEALTGHLQGTGSGSLYCPCAAPTQGVVSCTYEQWFKSYSPRRRYCQLPVSGRRMQQFLQFRLGCHGLPIATGWRWPCTGLTGFVWLATVVLLAMKCIWYAYGNSMQTFSRLALTPCAPFKKPFFAQQDHLGF